MFYYVEVRPKKVSSSWNDLKQKLVQIEEYCSPIEIRDNGITIRDITMKYLGSDFPHDVYMSERLRFKLNVPVKDFYSEYAIKECVRWILEDADFPVGKFFIFKMYDDGEFEYE